MHFRLHSISILVILASLAGCTGTSPQANFYSLESYHPDRTGYTTVVAIGPFEIPDYLDRPQLVIRRNGNELVIKEFERWAEPLSTAISRKIAGDVGTALPDVYAYEISSITSVMPNLRVVGQVWAFEATSDGTVVLSASWTIRSEGKATGIGGHGNYTRPLDNPDDMSEVTGLMNQLIDDLSTDINRGLSQAIANPPATSDS